MSSDNSTEDADREVRELLEPERIAELELNRNADPDENRRPERRRNIVKRHLSFDRKSMNTYIPLGYQDTNQNSVLDLQKKPQVVNPDPFKIQVLTESGEKKYEVDLNPVISLTSGRLTCDFTSVASHFNQTWKNISDLQPILDETVSAFRILSSQCKAKTSQEASKGTKVSLPDDTVQNQDLKVTLSNVPVSADDITSNQIILRSSFPEQVLSLDKIKNLLDLPIRKLSVDSSELESIIAAKSFNQIFSYCEYQYSPKKESSSTASLSSALSEIDIQSTSKTTPSSALPKDEIHGSSKATPSSALSETEIQGSSKATPSSALSETEIQGSSKATPSSALSEIEIQSLTKATPSSALSKIEPQSSSKATPSSALCASESSTERVRGEEVSICSPFGQILDNALSKLDRQSARAEPFFKSLLENLSILWYPGDHSEATIKAIEYNVDHRILKFEKEVKNLLKNILNFFNRIECLVRKWPLTTGIRTLKQYLGFVLEVEAQVIRINMQSLTVRCEIEFERLRILSGRRSDQQRDYSLGLYKKYYLTVKFISALEELRNLSEKFYSYIVKPLPSFLV